MVRRAAIIGEFLSQSAQDFIEDAHLAQPAERTSRIPEPISSGLH